ncbi:major royal jelly protein 3-like [Anastrepha ludens]|uniref:major royal jelly protein 3-like n=1 Tax=Anastrepha ludens TaxID=28586 RepID=UPI0023AEE757|nr:major royal jelly protein 3-like [Anastrepha ludens]
MTYLSFRFRRSTWFYFIVIFTIIHVSNSAYSHTYHVNHPWPSVGSNKYKELITVYEAKNLEFAFPSENEREASLRNGHYNPDSPLPIDVDVYYPPDGGEPTTFVTIPRFGSGVPYSLASLTNVVRPNGTEVQPYPSYDWHKSHGSNCDGLTSVYRIQIDSCGKMWILDSGEIGFEQHCSPQLLVLDIATSSVVHRYRLPEGMFKPTISRFITPYVDIEDAAPNGSCEQAFVYMADPTGTGFVVYDVVNGRSWRVENKYTFPDPDFGTHTVAGESFELLDGAFGFAVTPRGLGVPRMLYFHSLSNDAQVAIPLDIVNNQSYWNNGINSALEHFVLLGKRGVQCAAPAMTSNGVLLCGHLEPIGIFGWNILTPYTFNNRKMLAENPKTLQFASGLKVITNPEGKEEVWIVTNRLQKSFTGTIDFNEINYRILKCGVDELLQRGPC